MFYACTIKYILSRKGKCHDAEDKDNDDVDEMVNRLAEAAIMKGIWRNLVKFWQKGRDLSDIAYKRKRWFYLCISVYMQYNLCRVTRFDQVVLSFHPDS